MNHKVLCYIRQNDLIKIGSDLVLGVSGGSDSMALLWFFINNLENLGINKIKVCHINHMLRGKEAYADENLVKTFCEENNIECNILRVDIGFISKQSKKSIELVAREQRYAFFEKFIDKDSLIVTAHNLNDNIETFLYNSIRGTSIYGLCGIPVKRDNIIRPFLCVSKLEIEEYCSKNSIPFSVDYTNFSVDYVRNRIRNNIVTEFSKINLSYTENFRKMFELINEDREYIEIECDKAYKKICVDNKIDLNSISLIDTFILKKVIRAYLIKNSFQYNKKSIDLILNIILNKSGKLEICKDTYIKSDGQYLYIDRIERQNKSDFEITLSDGIHEISDDVYIYIEILDIEKYKKIQKKLFHCILDYDKINKAVFRTRREFDFVLFKDRCISKSLKKFLNEEKVDKDIRYKIPLLALDNRIIYIHSYYLDKTFCVNDETKKVILFKIGGLDF